jgi:tRNA threonylcarbamoyladenosine biosynthesis protein TsaE
MQASYTTDTSHAQDEPRRVELRSASVEETRRLGQLLGTLVQPGDVVLLEGNLGAGKTALAQGIGRGLGIADAVNSPTFTILKEYAGRLPLYHFDLYRIDDPDELFSLGFEDYLDGEGVCVVEWAERAAEPGTESTLWPASWLRIQLLKLAPDARLLRCTAHGTRGARLLNAFSAAVHAGEATQVE